MNFTMKCKQWGWRFVFFSFLSHFLLFSFSFSSLFIFISSISIFHSLPMIRSEVFHENLSIRFSFLNLYCNDQSYSASSRFGFILLFFKLHFFRKGKCSLNENLLREKVFHSRSSFHYFSILVPSFFLSLPLSPSFYGSLILFEYRMIEQMKA